MNVGKQIESKLIELEDKLFARHNLNESARLMLRMIEDRLDSSIESKYLIDTIKNYVDELETIYEMSLNDSFDGVEISQLRDRVLREYSILRYFFQHKNEILIEFSLEALTLIGTKEENSTFGFHNLSIEHVLTKEEMKLTKKEQKLILSLIKNITLTNNYPDYNFEIIKSKKLGNYVIANYNQKTYLQKK